MEIVLPCMTEAVRQGGSLMKSIKYARSTWTVSAVIVAAYLCRAVSFVSSDSVWFDFIRSILHTGLFTAWGFSVRRRIVQKQAQKYLISMSCLMVMWIVLKTYKYHIVTDLHIIRYIWYLFYVPMLCIPLLVLLAALSLGKPEDYRLPTWTWLLCIPTILLFLLVLTNDFHQWVFAFPEDAQVWTADVSHHALGYWIVSGWMLFCALGALVTLFIKSRVQGSRKRHFLPIIPLILALLYDILYVLGIPIIRTVLGDMNIVYCLLFTAVVESCIRCGLIQSNTYYDELFTASVDTSAQIVDENYVLHYAAHDAEPIPAEQMRMAESAPVMIEEGKRLHNMPICGGHVVWTEDILELSCLRRELEETQEQLQERNALLQYEYDREKEHKIIEEQNRLYDLLQSKTQIQLDHISQLVREYERADTDCEKQRILSKIVVLGSFVKRRKDMVLSLDILRSLPVSRLSSALAESFQALQLLHIQGSFFVQTENDYLSGEILTLAYDFFEDILETVLDSLHYINVRICPVRDVLRINILIDCIDSLAALLKKYPQMQIEMDEDGTMIVLPLEGGKGI